MIKLMELLKEATGNPKALILAGAPGSGKGYILKDLDLEGLKTFNIDNTFIDMLKKANVTLDLKNATPEERSEAAKAMASATKDLKTNIIPNAIANQESFVLDGTAASLKNTLKLKDELEAVGYEVFMLYVYTDLERSLSQNQERFQKSDGEDRSLAPAIVLSTWNSVTKNFEPYQQAFGKNFVSVANTGKAIKDLDQIVAKYLDPFAPKNLKPKTPKQAEARKKRKEKTNQELKALLSDDHIQNVIDSSVSRQEATGILNQFLS
jgi:adenylate kinase family enzyme